MPSGQASGGMKASNVRAMSGSSLAKKMMQLQVSYRSPILSRALISTVAPITDLR
jgi:hypothetical protein